MIHSWFAPVTVCVIFIVNTLFLMRDLIKKDKIKIGVDFVVYAYLVFTILSFYYLTSLSYIVADKSSFILQYFSHDFQNIVLYSTVALVLYGVYQLTGKWGRIGLQVILAVLLMFSLVLFYGKIDFWSGILILILIVAVMMYWIYCGKAKKKSNAFPIFVAIFLIYTRFSYQEAYDFQFFSYFRILIVVLAVFWTSCGITVKKKSVRYIVTGTVLIIAAIYLHSAVHSVYYSPNRMMQIFYENIDDFEEVAAYFKSPEYERKQDAMIYYDIRPSKVFCYSEGIEKYQVTDELAVMLTDLSKTGYYYELRVYRNGDICLFAKGNFILEYTSYEDIMAMMDETGYYKKMTDTEEWYSRRSTMDPRIRPAIADELDQR